MKRKAHYILIYAKDLKILQVQFIDRPEFMFSGVTVRGSEPYAIGGTVAVKGVKVDLNSVYERQDRVVDKLHAYDQSKLREGALAEELALLERIKDEINACLHEDRECGHCIDCGHVKHGE